MNWRRSLRQWLAFARLAILSQLEYRMNFLTDACISPLLTSLVEMGMWWTIFHRGGVQQLGGFSSESYMAYVLWASCFSRLTANWMYEDRMIAEVESGSINAILSRPVSFFQFYLGQFFGYKSMVATISICIPLLISLFVGFKIYYERLPIVLSLAGFYLIFTYTLSYLITGLAFFFTKVASFSMTKNLTIILLSGEVIPLDLFPEPLRWGVLHSPFAAACFLPVGYLTGRVGLDQLYMGMISIALGTLVVGFSAEWVWSRGLRLYSGTGA